jgi:hypothetical protein
MERELQVFTQVCENTVFTKQRIANAVGISMSTLKSLLERRRAPHQLILNKVKKFLALDLFDYPTDVYHWSPVIWVDYMEFIENKLK